MVDRQSRLTRLTGSRGGSTRWVAIAVLASGLAVGAAVLAQQLLPLRSILGLADVVECTPSYVYTRLPGRAASEDGHWRSAQSYPMRRDEVKATSLGGRIYVGTGLTVRDGAFSSLGEFFRFDPAKGTYESLPDVPERVDHAALVAHRNAVYVIGGYVDRDPTAAAWRYSVDTGRWEALAPMGAERGSPAAAVIGEKIYVVGGSRDDQGVTTGALSSMEIYDIDSGKWTAGPDMPTARHHHGAAAIRGRLIVVGGRNDDDLSADAVEQFDPVARRWTRLAPLPLGVGGVAVVAAGESLIAIGGGDDREHWITPASWALDPAENKWRRLADLNVARHGLAVAAVGPDVYVFAGSPCPGYGRSDAVELLTAAGRSTR